LLGHHALFRLRRPAAREKSGGDLVQRDGRRKRDR